MPRENTPLLAHNNNHHQPHDKSTFEKAISLIKAFPDGMAKTYATFGPVAILYHQGLWLIAPVMIGGTISISDEAFTILKKRYPDSELVALMARTTKETNQFLVGFLEDFGFTMGMMTTVAARFGGVEYYTNDFAKVIAPIASAIPAGVLRYMRNLHLDRQDNHLALKTIASTFRGANSPIFLMGLLQQQSVLSENSIMPSMAILGAAIIGLFAGLVNKKHPKLSLVLNGILETLLEPASLAAIFFAFPNDIFAATHHDEIKEGFFYTNAVVSSGYLLLLMLVNFMAAYHEWQEIEEEQPLLLNDIPADEERPSPPAAISADEDEVYSARFFASLKPGTGVELRPFPKP